MSPWVHFYWAQSNRVHFSPYLCITDLNSSFINNLARWANVVDLVKDMDLTTGHIVHHPEEGL